MVVDMTVQSLDHCIEYLSALFTLYTIFLGFALVVVLSASFLALIHARNRTPCTLIMVHSKVSELARDPFHRLTRPDGQSG